METPNIDQWFLRDAVWPYIRESCLVHDRCFTPKGALAWPEPSPEGNQHVGQDAYAADYAAQAQRLAPWIERLPSLTPARPDDKTSSKPTSSPQAQGRMFSFGNKTKVNIATPAYGSQYASVYVRTLYGLLTSGPANQVDFSFSEIDYADIVTARNYLISNFYFNLPDHTHLLFIDDDMGFDPRLVYDLLQRKQDLVGVIYPRRQFKPANLLQHGKQPSERAIALASEFVGEPLQPNAREPFVEVQQCGTGVMLISRACIKTMIEKCPEIVDPGRFRKMAFADRFKEFITPFNKIELEDRELSEDFSFCHRWVHGCGEKIYASTSHRVQHVGQFVADTQFSHRWT